MANEFRAIGVHDHNGGKTRTYGSGIHSVTFNLGDLVEVNCGNRICMGNISEFLKSATNEYVSVRWCDDGTCDSIHWTQLRFVMTDPAFNPERKLSNALLAEAATVLQMDRVKEAREAIQGSYEKLAQKRRQLYERGTLDMKEVERILEEQFPELF